MNGTFYLTQVQSHIFRFLHFLEYFCSVHLFPSNFFFNPKNFSHFLYQNNSNFGSFFPQKKNQITESFHQNRTKLYSDVFIENVNEAFLQSLSNKNSKEYCKILGHQKCQILIAETTLL